MQEETHEGHLPVPTGFTFADVWNSVRRYLFAWLAGTLAVGVAAFGLSYAVTPVFTASTVFLPPQQAQSAAATAISALGSLATLAGNSSVKSPAEQYVSLMQSARVSDRLIEKFQLKALYEAKFQTDARRSLADRVRFNVGKKDGLISVEVDDTDPQRAAQIANQYVDELRAITASLALTEAQQRRVFFEQHLARTRDRLTAAQAALQRSGFDPGALRAEPKAIAEAYAKLKSETAAAEVRLQVLRSSLADSTAEVTQQASALAALRKRMADLEATDVAKQPAADYVGKYRDYRYQEALFETYARQYELARVDESREGALIQVIDQATPPDRKSRPRRSMFALLGLVAGALLMTVWCTWYRLRALRGPAGGTVPRAVG